MLYQDPAVDAMVQGFAGPIVGAWSHDNRWVAVSDALGRVKLVGEDGSERLLTSEMSQHVIALRWSPDDTHLLVTAGTRAWIVTI